MGYESELSAINDVNEMAEADLRAEVINLKARIDTGYWDFANALHRVWKETLYMEWGHENWSEYVENELDHQLRSAQYMVGIVDYFGKMPQHIQDWVKSLGWSKAKELVKKVDENNFDEVRKALAGKSVSEIVQFFRNSTGSKEIKEKESNEDKPIRKGFSLHPDQLENVEAAIQAAMEEAKSDKEGHALDLISTAYLSTAGGSDGLEARLTAIERIFGVKLIAYNVSRDEIVYGSETLDSLAGDDE